MLVFAALVLGSAFALTFPEPALYLRPALQPAFALTLLMVGTLVRRKQLHDFAAAPARPLVGLAVQYTLMPLLAAATSLAFDDPRLRAGVLLVGCMPGAMASNLMTVLLRGDVVLSVTMTTLATLACPLVLALWLPLLGGAALPVDGGALAWDAAWMVALPAAAGMALRWVYDGMPPWWDRAAAALASLAVLLIVVVVVAANRQHLSAIGHGLAASMIGLNAGAYLAAFAAGALLRWPPPQRRTLVIEVGMQNAGLGSVLALSHLGESAAVPSAFYTVLCLLTTAAALPLTRRATAPRPAAAPSSST